MMPLEVSASEPVPDLTQVRWALIDRGFAGVVWVSVSVTILALLGGAAVTAPAYLERIVQIANLKYASGQLDPVGSIRIRKGDLAEEIDQGARIL